jgi:hypothetical protein
MSAWGDDPMDDVDDCHIEPDEDSENEMVLNCGLEGCLMPGEHMRSECHTVEMIEAQAREHEEAAFDEWFEQWQREDFGRHHDPGQSFRPRWGAGFKSYMRVAWMARGAVRTEVSSD